MKRQPGAIFRRIYLVVFLLIALLGLLFTGVTYLATTAFYAASTQLLNKDVAAHIAKFTSPYGREGFDRQKADSVFYQAMVISPSAEVYFLDTAGRVIYFHGDSSEIRQWQIATDALLQYIGSGGLRYISGPDPRDPDHPKIFSAAAVEGGPGSPGATDSVGTGAGGRLGAGARMEARGRAGEAGRIGGAGGSVRLGYIYVILGNQQYRSVTQMLVNSRITPMALGAVMFILAFSLLLTVLYIHRIRRRFDDMMVVLNKFRQGDFTARFALREQDELEMVTGSFNKMADLLLDNIDRVTASEQERRDFMVNISHDLRTPLAIARGYGETLLLKKGQLQAEEVAAYSEIVVGKLRQVEKMVAQLFELSKMESASFETHREPFVFSEVLQEIVHAVGDTGGAGIGEVGGVSGAIGPEGPVGKRAVPDCRHCTDGAYVEADISMMERVIQNLVVNAVAYTHDGGKISISLDRDGTDLVFRIGNEGDPLRSDLLEWLNGPENEMVGPGRPAIGLAIVRKILLLHHFAFRAEVLPGRVNVFTFRMPVFAMPASPAASLWRPKGDGGGAGE